MKKWQLLKIQEKIELKKLKYTNYTNLLNFTCEQVDVVLRNLDKVTIPILIEFFSILNEGKYDFDQFERLGIINIEEIIINKILNARDSEHAILILNWFKYKIDKFATKEEWQIFMDNLSDEMSLNNLAYVIDTFEDLRIEAIEKVIKNAKNLRTIYLCDVNKNNNLAENNLLDLLDLVIMGYDVKSSSKLINKLVEKYPKCIYDAVLRYLNNPVVFLNNLPKFFLQSDLNDFECIIEQLQKISDQSLLEKYLLYTFDGDNKQNFDNYINKIIDEENYELKESMTLLLDNKEKFHDLISELPTIQSKFAFVKQEDGRCIVMARLLNVLPYDIWIDIPFEVDILNLECIYNNYGTFLDILNIIDRDVVMKNIKFLSLSNLIKIFEMVKLKAFSDSYKAGERLYRMFDLKEQSFIDGSYKKCFLEEEKRKLLQKNEVSRLNKGDAQKIKTLGYILDVGYNVELVLEDYQSDDEISSKTLIKNIDI